MRRWLLMIPVVMFFACVVGCSTIDVKIDFDPAADFTRFHTFAFGGLTDITQTGLLDNSLVRKRIESAVARELTKKGLREVTTEDHPDLLVNYWIGTKDKQQVSGTSGPGVGGYRGGYYGGYGWGASYSTVTTYEYKEGTLVVDLVEPAKKELQWRATMVAILEDTTEGNIELGNKAIAEAFENYPPKKQAP
ncbi:MAG TPA: DUF4136 domain-containing protein [Nitrospiraceae bacterium]|nr:DUF4136 domain-containing protein [Nitrospiraceae bacterium]